MKVPVLLLLLPSWVIAAASPPPARLEEPTRRAAATSPGSRATTSVMECGAIGDGKDHPLSERFGTGPTALAAARAVYPRVTNRDQLREQIDRHALQKAIDVCPIGGTVLIPYNALLRIDRPVRLWHHMTLLGTGNDHSRPEPSHHPQLLCLAGASPCIIVSSHGMPPGYKPKEMVHRQYEIRGLKMRGPGHKDAFTNPSVAIGLRGGLYEALIERCTFDEFGTGIFTTGGWVARIEGNRFNSTGIGVRHDVTFSSALTWVKDPAEARSAANPGYEANAIHVVGNSFEGGGSAEVGILVLGPGAMMSIEKNTIEGWRGAAIWLSAYSWAPGGRLGEDGTQAPRAISIRDNYIESNPVAVRLGRLVDQNGMPLTAGQVANSGPEGVIVEGNLLNCGGTGMDHIVIHAASQARIEFNTHRYSKGVDILLDAGGLHGPFVTKSRIVAMNGFGGRTPVTDFRTNNTDAPVTKLLTPSTW